MKIIIIGSGWVGGNVGRGLQKLEHDVTFYDISEEKIRELREEGFKATSDLGEGVQGCEVAFLCVPTPIQAGSIELGYLEEVAEGLSSHLSSMVDFPVVTVKSTVVPGTTENLVLPILEDGSGLVAGEDFGVCMNPEFMTEISSSWTDSDEYEVDFFSEDRIVIGENCSRAGDVLENVYDGFDAPVVRTDLKTAEMIKYACNCMLSAKISYWNQIFLICQELGIDSDFVAQMAAMDDRIGEYGTVHGKAFGGKCLPKDLRAFVDFVKTETEAELSLLEAVENINDYMEENFGIRE